MIANLKKKDIIALAYITLLSIIAVVYGFSIIPSPARQQVLATDQKRVSDLSDIQQAVDQYYQDNSVLPTSLDSIKTQAYDTSTPLPKTDPQTKQPYEYVLTGPDSYQLCATFVTDSNKEEPNQYDATGATYPVPNGDFTHPIGHYCFQETETPNWDQPSPSLTCTGNCPSPEPIAYPTRFPCKAGRMCPMMPANNEPTPAIYNGNMDITPTPAPGVGGGSDQ